MIKSARTYLAFAVIAVVVCGGAYYYFTHAEIHHEMPSSTGDSPIAQPLALQDDDLKRKTLEGIGSVTNLKAVPLHPAPQR